MAETIKLDGKRVRVKFSHKKGGYYYTGGQRPPGLFDLLVLTYLNRKTMPGPWDLVLINTEIEMRVRMNDTSFDLEEWIKTNLDMGSRNRSPCEMEA